HYTLLRKCAVCDAVSPPGDKVSRPVYCSPKAVLQSRTFLLLFWTEERLFCFDIASQHQNDKRSSERLLEGAIRANQRTQKAAAKKGASQTASLLSDYFISPYKSILKALTIDFELVFCSFLFRLEVIYLSIK